MSLTPPNATNSLLISPPPKFLLSLSIALMVFSATSNTLSLVAFDMSETTNLSTFFDWRKASVLGYSNVEMFRNTHRISYWMSG
jgi:hypothetical protein